MRAFLITVASLCLSACQHQAPAAEARAAYASATREMAQVALFREHAGQGNWSPSGSRIAYAAKNADGYYEVHLSHPDGSADIALTARTPNLPKKHVGMPSWHASERWLLVTAEKPGHGGSSFDATPGFAGYTDIWVVSIDGRQAYPLTNLPNDPDHGVLIPRFSPDGRQVVWSERTARPNLLTHPAGLLVIRIADFVETPLPHLEHIRSFLPGGSSFYETYGFSPDGRRIIFCSNMGDRPFLEQQLYTIDAATGGDLQQLTDTGYNEHAAYTRDGQEILWMSNVDSMPGADWWIMRADGSHKRRLSYFNQRGSPEYMGSVWAGMASFAPGDHEFIADIQLSLVTQETTMRKVTYRRAP
jgi:hypothetical protein